MKSAFWKVPFEKCYDEKCIVKKSFYALALLEWNEKWLEMVKMECNGSSEGGARNLGRWWCGKKSKGGMWCNVVETLKGDVVENLKGDVVETLKGDVVENLKGDVVENLKGDVVENLKGGVVERILRWCGGKKFENGLRNKIWVG